MLAYLHTLTNSSRRLPVFRRVSSTISQDDEIPLSQMDATCPPQDLIKQDNSTNRQEVHALDYFLCYLFHIILVAIHIVLLVIAYYHPEHRIIISSSAPSKAFTIGLSGGLQAFYTIYTTVLVSVTQRLVLSNVCSSSTKLTQIHDICGAWYGLGASLSALWQQTRVASSIYSVALVTVYFIGISALHVASSTIMEFQPFNTTMTSTAKAVSTWPDPTSEFTSTSNWFNAALSFSPIMQMVYGDTTLGLVNNTLYDVPLPSFFNATVKATTVNTQCGLLTNLSVDNNTGNINVSMPMIGLGPLTFYPAPPPMPNEVWFTTPSYDNVNVSQPLFIAYFVSAKIEPDESVSGNSYVYINGTFSSPGNVAQNFTTKTYIVGCTLDTTTTTATLGSSSAPLAWDDQPSSATWPIFSLGGDANFTSSILGAVASVGPGESLSNVAPTPNCLPIMLDPYWQNMTTFEAYMTSSLGINLSSCDSTPSIEQYTGTPYVLTRDKMESAISQIAAQFVWIAGQLGEVGGGFDRQTDDAQIVEYVLKWRLNINILPVISSLSVSVALSFLAVCMLWGRNNRKVVVGAAGLLEIMWLGSRSVAIRGYLCGIHHPSADALRSLSMFKTTLWTHSLYVHADKKAGCSDSDICTVLPSHDSTSRTTLEAFGGHVHVGQLRRTRSRRWCYALHIALVSSHVALLLLLIHHPEHHVTIPLETTTFTTGLSALLQATYTLYAALLVFLLQHLAFQKMVGEWRKLTTVHDLSGAWTGIGTAATVLWKQRQLASSPWEVLTVLIYLTSMLVLHITSSSIMQWQAFGTSLAVGVLQSNLALPDNTVNISSQFQWSEISSIACLAGQDSNLSTYGLSGSTIYDIPQVPENVTASAAVVNATTFSTRCGLVPNLTLLSAYSVSGAEQYQIGFSLNTSGNNTLLARPMWKDLSVRIDGQCTDCAQTLFYMITTAINVNESIHDPVALNLNWTYTPLSATNPQNLTSTTVTYVAACSVSTSTTQATLNLQDQELVLPPNQSGSSASASWSVWSWSPAAATNLNLEMVTVLSQPGYYTVTIDNTYVTYMDECLMSFLGLNVTAFLDTSLFQSSADPSATLTPAQLENVLSQTAAKLMFFAGQLGEANGGFNRTVGQSQATQQVVQYRLNINTIPVVFASGASFVALVIAILILGRKPIQSSSSSVSGMSVLESLWLAANSEEIHAHLQAIDELDEDKLREAGMFYIRLGDVKARRSWRPSASESEISEQATLVDNSEYDDVIDIRGDH